MSSTVPAYAQRLLYSRNSQNTATVQIVSKGAYRNTLVRKPDSRTAVIFSSMRTNRAKKLARFIITASNNSSSKIRTALVWSNCLSCFMIFPCFPFVFSKNYWSASASTSLQASKSGTKTIIPRMVAL